MKFGVVLALLCAVAVSGCNDLPDLNGPSLDFTTEEFTGTLQPGGTVKHDFTIRNNGQLTATVLSAGSAQTIKLGIGVPAGATCNPLSGAYTTFNVSAPPEITGPVTPGPLCVILADDGTLTEAINYRIRVQHT